MAAADLHALHAVAIRSASRLPGVGLLAELAALDVLGGLDVLGDITGSTTDDDSGQAYAFQNGMAARQEMG